MIENALQKSLVRVLAAGTAMVTIFLMVGSTVSDPVNAPKLFILGGVSGAALAILILGFIRAGLKIYYFDYTLAFFVAWSALVLSMSHSPFSQNFYGVYGRNTGWLTYLLLAILASAAVRISGRINFDKIVGAFLFTLGANLFYGLWVILFGDFLGWNNIYGALLGTFGNPNFISSFLGMGFSVVLALIVVATRQLKIIGFFVLFIISWQLVEAESLQGIVIAAIGFWLVTFFWIRGKFSALAISRSYFGLGAFIGFVGVLGALGHGPLKQALAQQTVALREQYWLAALNMTKANPVFGVGMDSYGDWYRRARDQQALITPGPNTVTNVSHNVFLDMLANGGLPLFASYLIIVACGFFAIIRVAIRKKNYDPTFVALSMIWVGYQTQSIISINQIGLAVWGWLLTGLLVAYEVDSRKSNAIELQGKVARKKSKPAFEVFSPQLVAAIGATLGLFLAVPPLSADMKWRSIQTSGQASLLTSTFSGSYLAPLNSFTLASSVQLLENSNLPDLAIRYARQGVKFNPQSMEAWKMLYYSTNSTQIEKSKAKSEMIRLDPLNPEWKKLRP